MAKSKHSSKKNQNKDHTKKITNPHDRFFRGAMSDPEVARAFINRHILRPSWLTCSNLISHLHYI